MEKWYKSANTYEQLLRVIRRWPGAVGRSAGRKLARRYKRRAEVYFMEIVNQTGPGDICIDLGANMGDYTEKMAVKGAEVHAYEPDPYCFAILEERFAGRAGIHLHPYAVGAKKGTAQLRRVHGFESDPRQKSQGSSVVFSDSAQFSDETIDVEIVAFKDMLASFPKPVSVVKMDIEGAEFDILEQVFADPQAVNAKAMFVETHEWNSRAKVRLVQGLRLAAERITQPRINLYWP